MSLSSSRKLFETGGGYVLPSEKIEVSQRLHWAPLILPFLAALGSLFLAGYLTGQMSDRRGPLDDIIWLAALGMIGRLIYKLELWNNGRFMVTRYRIVMVTGVFNRKVAMMPLPRVTDMTYQQSLFGRIFGWGTFVIESAGQDQALRTIDYLPNPDVLYATVCDMLFQPQAKEPQGADG